MNFIVLRHIKRYIKNGGDLLQKRFILGLSQTKVEPEEKDTSENAINDNVEDVTVNCNKSGLLEAHRNRLLNRPPYKEPHSWIHLTEKYQRKMFALYGFESGVDPRICFYTKSDLQKIKSYEQVAEPYSLQYMMAKAKEEKRLKKDAVLKREEEISKKMEKLEHWKAELRAKVAKKEAEAIAAKERKDRLVEEVRRHFGYKMDPRDERFKEVLEQKEKEEKKKLKEMKRQAKEQKLINKLVASSSEK